MAKTSSPALFDAGGLQHVDAAAIAIIDGVAEAFGDIDQFGIEIDGGDFDAAAAQHLGDDLAKAADPDDDGAAFVAYRNGVPVSGPA